MSQRFWDGFLVLQARPVTRRLRQLFVGSYLFCIGAQFAGVVFSLTRWREGAGSRIYGIVAFLYVSTAMGLALLSMFLMRRVNSGTSLEDRAELDFGKPYEQLSSKQKFDVWVRARREIQAGGRAPDERDALAQREAERQAFRILRIGAPVLVAGFWVVCLCLPPSGMRVGLLMGAAVMSGIAIAVVILPDGIRMWTQPDEVGEPKVMEREA
jgi:hypothetical protein